MDSKAWLVEQLTLLGVDPNDKIVHKGFHGAASWFDILLEAERVWGLSTVPSERFDALVHFGDLGDLIEEFRVDGPILVSAT